MPPAAAEPGRRRVRPPAPDGALAEALAGARRLAVVGVGSDLRGDDAAGLRVARRLAAWAARTGTDRLAAFAGGTAPENLTGEISRYRPDCLVLVDAAHLGRAPGEVRLVAPEQVRGPALSTHLLPVPILLDYLRATTGCRAVVVGIQLGQKEVLAPLTPAVARGVRRLVAALQRAASAPVGAGRPAGPAARPAADRRGRLPCSTGDGG